jgi:signal transduction histidine kinase
MYRMPDQEATPDVEIGTGMSRTHSSVPFPDQTQRAAIMGQLSGGILHEFNNILTVISGTIDILAQAVVDRPELAAITRLIDEAALRGARLTSQLLAFERGQPPQYRAVDVNALVSDASRLLQPVVCEQIDMVVSSHADAIVAVADPGLLMAAILKLAIAARNAMPGGGRVSITAAVARAVSGAHDGAVEIKVDTVSLGTSSRSPVWGAGDLVAIENLVTLSGGDLTIHRHVDRVEFEIRLRKADTDG